MSLDLASAARRNLLGGGGWSAVEVLGVLRRGGVEVWRRPGGAVGLQRGAVHGQRLAGLGRPRRVLAGNARTGAGAVG